jgi:hypothetical protein
MPCQMGLRWQARILIGHSLIPPPTWNGIRTTKVVTSEVTVRKVGCLYLALMNARYKRVTHTHSLASGGHGGQSASGPEPTNL